MWVVGVFLFLIGLGLAAFALVSRLFSKRRAASHERRKDPE